MSSGERPIGTAKGKQPNTEALSPPPPQTRPTNQAASQSGTQQPTLAPFREGQGAGTVMRRTNVQREWD